MQRRWQRKWKRDKVETIKNTATPSLTLRVARTILPPIAAAGIFLMSMANVYANPTGGTVTTGAATITQAGTTTTINQTTNKTSINWQSFNIAANERVNFVQPSASSVALNRVVGNNASSIYGQLNANGQVFLINPNGVLFAPGAQVNVGGLVASTLNMTDANFQNGNYKFTGTGGSVVNQGTITASNGGYVAMLGGNVSNQGVIVAKQGTVALGAGNAVTLDMQGDGLVSMAVSESTMGALAENKNLIQANGGTVLMTASAADSLAGTVVNNSGIIQAQSVNNVNGVIRLDGGTNGTVTVSGTLDASGTSTGQTGGTIKVLGNTLSVDNATLTTSGDAGGGTILIGGGAQGQGSEQHAMAANIGANTVITADALTSGNGGNVVVWSDGITTFNGSISARGGTLSGNGGSVETSGHILNVGTTANVTTLAAKGAAGTWLLDPYELNIGDNNQSTYDLDVATLVTALNNNDVEIWTNYSYGTGGLPINSITAHPSSIGDITIWTPITGWTSNTTLTLGASGNINVNASIIGSGAGTVKLIADAYYANQDLKAPTAGVYFNNGSTIQLGTGGTVSIQSHGFTVAASGGNITGAQLGTMLSTANVDITTLTASEDISVNNAITNWGTGATTLSLNASHNVNINADITGTAGNLNLTADKDQLWRFSNYTSGKGIVNVSSGVKVKNSNVSIYSDGFDISAVSGNIRGTDLATMLASGNVTITTGNRSPVWSGDITVNDNIITPTGGPGSPTTLTLKSNGNILFAQGKEIDATGSGQALNVVLWSNAFDNNDAMTTNPRNAGGIKLDNTTIKTNGGSIIMGGQRDAMSESYSYNGVNRSYDVPAYAAYGSTATNGSGIYVDGSHGATTLDAGGGKISLSGCGNTNVSSSAVGINFNENATATSTITTSSSGSIYLYGAGGIGTSGSGSNHGIILNNTTVANSQGGISLDAESGNGDGGSNYGIWLKNTTLTSQGNIQLGSGYDVSSTNFSNVSSYNYGIRLDNTTLFTSQGYIYLNGDGGDGGGGSNYGVMLNNATLTASQGSIYLDGRGGDGDGGSNHGIMLDHVTLIASQGSITLEGSGGDGNGGSNYGVMLTNTALTAKNDIDISAYAGWNTSDSGLGDNNHGLFITGSTLTATAGGISITGEAGDGSNSLAIRLTNDNVLTASNSAEIRLQTDGGGIALNGNLTAGGIGIDIEDSNVSTFTNNANIDATKLWLYGTDTNFVFTDPTKYNFSTIYNSEVKSLTYNSNKALTLGDGSSGGITAYGGDINITTTAGGITVTSPIASYMGKTTLTTTTTAGDGDIKINSSVGSSNAKDITLTANTGNIEVNQGEISNSGNINIATTTGEIKIIESNIRSGGNINIVTNAGNITITSNGNNMIGTEGGNILLNAGQGKAAGDATGGNIIITDTESADSLLFANQVLLYTGSVAGSTGVTEAVGYGSGNFRYNSNQTTAKYDTVNAPLGSSGTYAVYRENVTVTVAADDQIMTYGTSVPTLTTTVTGLQNGDSLQTSANAGGSTSTSGKYTAGTHAITPSYVDSGVGYTIVYGNGSGVNGTGTLAVAKAQLTIAGNNVGVQDRTYDGSANVTVSYANSDLTGLITNDIVNVYGVMADKNAGSNKAINFAINGTDAANYDITSPLNLAVNIAKANLTTSGATAQNRTYDSTTAVAISGETLNGIFGNDNVTVSGGGTIADKNAGQGKAVTATLTLSGTDAANYTLTQPTGLTADISKATLTTSGATAQNRTYDGTTAVAISGETLIGVITGDNVSVSGGGTMVDKNAGQGKAVTATLTLSGTDVANYTLTQPTGLTADISKATLTTSSATAQNRSYDGTTAVAISGETLIGVISGDNVSVSGGGTMADKNAGQGKTVTAALTLSGTDAANYNLTQPTGLTADISKATLTTSGATAQNRTYDGATAVAISGETLNGIFGNDNVSVSGGGTISDSNAGQGKAVTANLILGGADAGNYILTQPTGLTVNINPADTYQGAVHSADKTTTTNTANTTTQNTNNLVNLTVTTATPSATITSSTGLSMTTVGGNKGISIEVTADALTVNFGKGSNASGAGSRGSNDVALVDVGAKGKEYYKIASSSDSMSITNGGSTAAALPTEPAANAPSTTFSINTADGSVAKFQVSYAEGALSIKPLNDSATAIASEAGSNKKLVAATGLLAAQQDLTVDTQSVAAIYLH